MGSQSVSQYQDNMGVKLNISLLFCLVSLTAAASLQEENPEGEGRFLFANYTSGLLALMSVNSSTYSLATLVLGGGALLLAIVYLWTVAPAELANTEYSQYYRADNTGLPSLSGDIDLVSLVSSAIKIYSKLNDEDED